jgi:predicted lipoprotein with Yx(FWY)xxD motif
MRFRICLSLLSLTTLLALCFAACGTGASGANAPTPSPTATATTAPTLTPTPATAASPLPVKTASVSVNGAAETILVTAQGVTLYYRTSDSGASVYSGPAWPALLSTNGSATSSVPLPGHLALLQDANGAQVTYNGHPLYTYAGDGNTPGTATGNGIGNIWFVVPPTLQ